MPEKSVRELVDTPIMIIHGMEDDIISYRDSESIYRGAKEPKELWLVPDAEHGNASEISGEEYNSRVVGFFERHLVN